MEGSEPRITDIPYKLLEDEHYPAHQLDLTPVLGGATPGRTRIEIAGFDVRPSLGHRLILIYNDNFLTEKRPVNMCIQAIHKGRGYKWCDNLLAVRNANKRERAWQYQDITPADVEAVKRYSEQGGYGHAALEYADAVEESNWLRDKGFQTMQV
ncbi:hypothetical protein DICSQDRAFT_164914 [Dichomitus squalens LYAD-421 SS1]|uniref:uncharacterized protein n=1 Tax=Dichomitus squalens (strain LYAD-421) TaxID=732165 RepID=UPI00044142BA|nr:uncharacterized protein DICSQDRAFT_164914 [Dichomitus squalens LYAD-421 SS1]EJF67077.1 hypothetical protein DICSQDRAFT_164914 [Dichomitus squalens LYAD-421 SS1]